MIIAIPHANSNPKWKEGNSGPSELERDFGPPSMFCWISHTGNCVPAQVILQQNKQFPEKN
ncbi:uncharacterized protein LOC141881885 isoform X3 [Acropora palmata]|uniref:uncharacterized protein LOC141881885 isoform X3 n=1 Tax=Acropora palmata TaxID=6131 RepID=UPI003D9FC326